MSPETVVKTAQKRHATNSKTAENCQFN